MLRTTGWCAFFLLGLGALGRAQYVPSWWVDNSAPVLNTGAGAQKNNYGVANLAQLKWMATRAKAHFDATLPGGAGTSINTLVAGFGLTHNYRPINLGQLKVIAKPFYDRLIAAGYSTNQNLKANGYSPLWTGNYPWNSSTSVSANYKPVTIGQLKLAFSFDVVDSNQNGTMDYLEGFYPAASLTRDTDGDGVPDVLDAFPNDPTRAIALTFDPNDHKAPTITVTNPSGTVLTP